MAAAIICCFERMRLLTSDAMSGLQNNQLTFGSLFAGVGGFDLGLEAAGFRCEWQVEWDKHCQQVLSHHWPDVPKYLDVRDVSGYELHPVDVISFGSPCQDLSVAGKRAGLEGERSGLFHEAIRIIKEMRHATGNVYPRWGIWENVAGALSSNKGADFGVVLDQMAEHGAVAIEWAMLDARWFGVPQRRRRVFVIACFDPAIANGSPDPLLPVSPRSGWNPPPSRASKQVAARLFASSPREDGEGSGVTRAVSTTVFQPGAMVRQGGAVWEEGPVPTLRAEAHNGDNSPHILQTFEEKVAYSIREDAKANNFSATETDTALALTAQQPSVQSHHAQLFIVNATHDSEARIYSDATPTLTSRMGTGGNNVPLVAEQAVNFDEYNFTGGDDVHHSIRAGTRQSTGVLQMTLADARDCEATVDPIGFSHTQGLDAMPSTEIFPTLRAEGGGHAVVYNVYGGSKRADRPEGGFYVEVTEETKTLDSSTGLNPSANQGGVIIAEPDFVIRRLTPLECERLMGWPENHTLYRADGKTNPDSTRYKMCGNGVVSNVAEWVGTQIRKATLGQ